MIFTAVASPSRKLGSYSWMTPLTILEGPREAYNRHPLPTRSLPGNGPGTPVADEQGRTRPKSISGEAHGLDLSEGAPGGAGFALGRKTITLATATAACRLLLPACAQR